MTGGTAATGLASLATVVALAANPASGADPLVLTTATAPPLHTEAQTGFLDLVAQEALSRVGRRVWIVKLPGERALLNANAGIDDGDLNRIGGLSRRYQNLIQVPEATMTMEFVALGKQARPPISDWGGLKPYSVGIINGWKILERNTTEVAELTKVKNAGQLLTLLQRDRADLVLISRWLGLHQLRARGITEVKLLAPPLAVREMFIYLHTKHRDLVPRVARALREMKADGSYQRIYRRILLPLTRE